MHCWYPQDYMFAIERVVFFFHHAETERMREKNREYTFHCVSSRHSACGSWMKLPWKLNRGTEAKRKAASEVRPPSLAVDTRCPFAGVPPYTTARKKRRNSPRLHFDKMLSYLRRSRPISCISDLTKISVKITIEENNNNKNVIM